MPRLSPEIDHLLRRAGFGVSDADVQHFRSLSPGAAVADLVDYEGRPDDVDARIGRPDHARVATEDLFAPDIDIDAARQRWLFRMVHTRRSLQEKMALFWHNHFATAYRKLAGDSGPLQAARMMAHKPGPLRGPQGQLELFRQYALGNFRDLLLHVAQDPAMLVWLDGQSNRKTRPQENFPREIMELFTLGVGSYTEADVYAAARVFTGWNLRLSEGFRRTDMNAYQEFFYDADEHDTDAKTFTFAVSTDGGRTIPARGASAGIQDGVDLITALAFHPETARRLARKLWDFFVSETHEPDEAFVEGTAGVYLRNRTEIRPVVRYVLTSPWFNDPSMRHTRYSWPAEFVARAIREIGWQNLALDEVLTPLANMGMTLFEPPNVGGWPTGAAWFSTATMLARTGFAASLAILTGLRSELRHALRGLARRPARTSLVVLTLAAGIAAVATIYSVVDAVLVRPLPYRDGDRIVTLGLLAPDRPWREDVPSLQQIGSASVATFTDWKARSQTMDALVAAETSRSLFLPPTAPAMPPHSPRSSPPIRS